MGISTMQKILIGVHKSEKAGLLQTLQEKSILHIRNIKENTVLATEIAALMEPQQGKVEMGYKNKSGMHEEEERGKELESAILLLGRAIDYLKKFGKQPGFLDSFLPQKLPVSDDFYRKTISDSQALQYAEEARKLEPSLTETDREITSLNSQKTSLLPWVNLQIPLEDIGSLKIAVSVAGVVTNKTFTSSSKKSVQKIKTDLRKGKDIEWEEKIKKLPIDFEIISRKDKKTYIIMFWLPENNVIVKKFLSEIGFETIVFPGLKGVPNTLISNIEKEIAQFENQREQIINQTKLLAQKIGEIYILYDYYSNLLSRKNAETLALSTDKTICLIGWIRTKDYNKLETLASQFDTVSISKIAPDPGEEPPVELENKKGVRDFESITELYSVPRSSELDPTPLLAPFFIICFGLCYADAGYGIMFGIISLLLMRKISGDKKLLYVLFYGAIAAVIVGALTGGWFGDFIDRFNIPVANRLNHKIMLFNPMENPLAFFVLSLTIGIIQIFFGFIVGFVKSLRQGKVLYAFTGSLAWLLFWVSILIFAFSFKLTALHSIGHIFPYIATGIALFILFYSGVPSRSFFIRLAKGGLNLYQGLMGTVGDIFSYSRLTAVGLVSSGMAMCINIFVELALKLPLIIGIIAAVIVFIFGHLLSLGINVLGAFVHSLRLQYAEFFTKFFEGGGEKFTPFRLESKYVVVEK